MTTWPMVALVKDHGPYGCASAEWFITGVVNGVITLRCTSCVAEAVVIPVDAYNEALTSENNRSKMSA